MTDLQTVLRDWEAVIGLEVHTELTTLNTKMFCSCKVEYGAAPNTHVCPVCLGLPGALPVPNKAAIESIVLAGLATNCEIEKRSMFYRKNYFYPDMSKDFQTTQGPVAFCMRGWLDLEVAGNAAAERVERAGTTPLSHVPLSRPSANGAASDYITRIGITRIHMEEDAGKMIHKGGADGRIAGAAYSLVDYNRCGTPLIELVTEPDLRTPEEARLFLQKLRQIFLTLRISDCSMEEGSLRCDGNVSLRRRSDKTLGTKTELKNMNSFKNLHDALAYEICRQAEVLESGGTVAQETRHWEPSAKRTITMRVKETADDYRLFPEPDLAPYDLSDEFIATVRSRLPELPDAKKQRYLEEFGLAAADAATLAADVELSAFFDAAVRRQGDGSFVTAQGETTQRDGSFVLLDVQMHQNACFLPATQKNRPSVSSPPVPSAPAAARTLANLLLNEVSAFLNAEGQAIATTRLTPQALAELARLLDEGTISSKQCKEVLNETFTSGEAPTAIVERLGIRQVSDVGELEAVVVQVLEEFSDKAAEYRGGKTGLLGFFVGQAMKATGGQANPRLLNELFTERLQ